MTEEKEKEYLESVVYGGSGGSPFEEVSETSVLGFTIWYSQYITAIQVSKLFFIKSKVL